LDYGDGIFPSKWPTDIIQDEVQGWMLRVAPMREPVAKYSFGWEEYEDLSPIELYTTKENSKTIAMKRVRIGKEEQKRTFFFNRVTFEATYDVPEDIAQERYELEQLNHYHHHQQHHHLQQQDEEFQPLLTVNLNDTTGYFSFNDAKISARDQVYMTKNSRY
jgi:hypothetical protein